MTDFAKTHSGVVKEFFEPQAVRTISQYLENLIRRHPTLLKGDHNNKIIWYADPLTEVILKNSLPAVEAFTGLELYPTYSFARVYQKGDRLKPHVDREACEISVTCNIAVKGAVWPFYTQLPQKAEVVYYLEPGDACIYRGCDVVHWRNEAVDTDINVQIMLHYVDKNGPNAGYKFDGRTSLAIGD